MTEPAWRIASWDRARGQGSIEAGEKLLEFDASVALVDDFEVGEGVHVDLAKQGISFRVTKLWPDDPRVPDPGTPERPVPELDLQVQSRLFTALESMDVYNDYRIERLERGNLLVYADDVLFEQGPSMILRFIGVEYIDLPFAWDGKRFRLANSKERTYLASRCEMRSDTAAIKIVDADLRPYFVVCSDFTSTRATDVESSTNVNHEG